MDVKTALAKILMILKNTEGDIETVLEDVEQTGYDKGYNDGNIEGFNRGKAEGFEEGKTEVQENPREYELVGIDEARERDREPSHNEGME